MESVICKLANLSEVQESESRPEGSFVVLSGQDKYYVLASVEVDREAEKEKVLKELEYTRGFLEAVEKKLSNEKFVQNAKPEVLANEQRKKEDALRKIRALEDSL
jgi:valyl-tRNA synthetase